MKKLDKKQIPQFAALCVLSAGVFGYFVVKIVTPSPAAAGNRPHPTAEAAPAAPAPSPVAAKKADAGLEAAPAAGEDEAPAPTPGMRDPFVVGYVDPKTQPSPPAAPALPAAAVKPTPPAKLGQAGMQVASIRETSPAAVGVPAFPSDLKALAPLPAAPKLPVTPVKTAAPAWTVTGVLQNETGQVAILRNGEARRIVRTGDFVSSAYRVVAVTRSAVVLRHGKTFFHLTLGDAKTAAPTPAKAALPAVSAPDPALKPIPKPIPAPQDDAQAPAGHPAESAAGLAQVIQAALLLARSYMAPAQTEVDFCLAAFHARRPLPPDVAMHFLDGSTPAPGSLQTQPRWQQALTQGNLGRAAEAGKRLNHYD